MMNMIFWALFLITAMSINSLALATVYQRLFPLDMVRFHRGSRTVRMLKEVGLFCLACLGGTALLFAQLVAAHRLGLI